MIRGIAASAFVALSSPTTFGLMRTTASPNAGIVISFDLLGFMRRPLGPIFGYGKASCRVPTHLNCSAPKISTSVRTRSPLPTPASFPFAPTLARAAVATGVDGVFMETHMDPRKALSDAANAIAFKDVAALWKQLVAIDAVVKGSM